MSPFSYMFVLFSAIFVLMDNEQAGPRLLAVGLPSSLPHAGILFAA